MARIVGFTGCKGSGKDLAGSFLVDKGFTRLAFADKMKEAVAILFGITVPEVDLWKAPVDCRVEISHRLSKAGTDHYVVVASYTWREFLQRFGTEMGRNTFGQDFWVELALPDFPVADTVVTDVRFDNEAARIIKLGGKIYEIVRPGYEPDGHASEDPIDRDLIDGRILNDGTMSLFRTRTLNETLR